MTTLKTAVYQTTILLANGHFEDGVSRGTMP